MDDSCRETLALTKMNRSNDGPCDRLPATLDFADSLAMIVKLHALEEMPGPQDRRFRHRPTTSPV